MKIENFYLIIILLCFLTAIPVSFGQSSTDNSVLIASVEVCQDDSVVLDNLVVTSGIPEKRGSGGDYVLQLIDKKNKPLYEESFDISFILYDVPEKQECDGFSIEAPYTSEYSKLTLYKKGRLIFSQDFQIFCNQNNVCDASENFFSCPQDCPSGVADGICDGELYDNVCDPDCNPVYDWKDCNVSEKELQKYDEEHKIVPKTTSSIWNWAKWAAYLAVLAVVVFSGFKVYKKVKAKMPKQEKKKETKKGEKREKEHKKLSIFSVLKTKAIAICSLKKEETHKKHDKKTHEASKTDKLLKSTALKLILIFVGLAMLAIILSYLG